MADFVPPIAEKLLQRIPFGGHRRHPFNAVPAGLDARNILDVGANVGRVAEAALRTYPRSKVYCFEPVSGTYQILQKRLAPFGDRVKLYPQALSNVNAQAEINLTGFSGANSISPQSAFHKFFNPSVQATGKETIRLTRLDDLAGELPEKIDIMKIDVEGHELQVLQGGETFIQNRVDTIIVEIALSRDASWGQQSVFEIFALMKRLGFCLINVMDLYHSQQTDLLLVQMDCVFRKQSLLKMPEPAS